MQESDTYLMILDEGEKIAARENVLLVGEELLGTAEDSVKTRVNDITDPDRLKRRLRRAMMAASWQEILDTPSGGLEALFFYLGMPARGSSFSVPDASGG